VLKIIAPAAPLRLNALVRNRHIEMLLDAARRGEALESAMARILQAWQFDSFMHVMSPSTLPLQRDDRAFIWTTLPPAWVALYAAHGHIETDPRIALTYNRNAPFLWDAADFAHDPRYAAFLADAAAFGIRSGVTMSFRDPTHGRVVVAFNSSTGPVTPRRQRAISARLGDMVLFAVTFHDVFMASIVDGDAASSETAVRLSARELQCLALAASGMTSRDIGFKLGIKPRTANYHFGNIIEKLGVLNRNEAIAVAVAKGLVRREGSVAATSRHPGPVPELPFHDALHEAVPVRPTHS